MHADAEVVDRGLHRDHDQVLDDDIVLNFLFRSNTGNTSMNLIILSTSQSGGSGRSIGMGSSKTLVLNVC